MTVGGTTVSYNFEFMKRTLADKDANVWAGRLPDTVGYAVRDADGEVLCVDDGPRWRPMGHPAVKTRTIWAATAREAALAADYAADMMTHKFFRRARSDLSVWKVTRLNRKGECRMERIVEPDDLEVTNG